MSVATAPKSLPAERFLYLEEAFSATAAVAAAGRLGLLNRLRAGPADVATLARECGIGERGTGLLLSALASLGLVERATDGSYSATTGDLDWLLARRDHWDGLAEAIRHDRPLVAADTRAGAAAFYPRAVAALASIVAPAAERAAPLILGLSKELAAPGARILDVGAGAAPWSLAIAAHSPNCRVTAVDVPETLDVTRAAVAAAGRESQFDYLAGDLFGVGWEAGAYDLAIAANICHLFDETANCRLLGRLFGALRPGGTVAILDILPDERFDGPPWVALYALGLLLRTGRGQVYPFSTYATWLHEAGFEAIERQDLTATPPMSLIAARRPD